MIASYIYIYIYIEIIIKLIQNVYFWHIFSMRSSSKRDILWKLVFCVWLINPYYTKPRCVLMCPTNCSGNSHLGVKIYINFSVYI